MDPKRKFSPGEKAIITIGKYEFTPAGLAVILLAAAWLIYGAFLAPAGLFTDDEIIYAAMIDRFEIDLARPSWPVNRWLNAMLRLFRPQIVALIEARDRRLAEWAAGHPERNTYEDRELEVTSTIDISIDDQIAAVRAALG